MTAQPELFEFKREVPRWAVPFLDPMPFKGAKGGRASGKSHERAEAAIEEMVANPDFKIVCIREVQKSLKYSMRALLISKIRKLGVRHLFRITLTEITRIGGDGLIIFEGMQDHTADSIKSLEGFDLAVCEEAQSLSKRSIALLTPTIRKENSEIWFIWNPDQPDDAIEEFFDNEPDAIVVHVNYSQNPWLPEKSRREAAKAKIKDFEAYTHVWLGGFNTKSEAQIFKGLWRVDEFDPKPHWHGPYYGLDWGFSADPSCFVRCYVGGNTLYIDQDAGRVGLDLDETATFVLKHDPKADQYTMRADSARPESISYLKKKRVENGEVQPYLPKMVAVKKGPGSVRDGIEHIKTYDEIVIHSRCDELQTEARLYSYKTDRHTGDILPDIVDAHNHRWDAVRYALRPRMKNNPLIFEAL